MLINGNSDYLVVPADCLNRWMVKFEEKYKKDPNFILKTTTHWDINSNKGETDDFFY